MLLLYTLDALFELITKLKTNNPQNQIREKYLIEQTFTTKKMKYMIFHPLNSLCKSDLLHGKSSNV